MLARTAIATRFFADYKIARRQCE